MSSSTTASDVMRMGHGSLPTPDAMMEALIEHQAMLKEKDQALEEQSAEIQNQQGRIKVPEERLQPATVRQCGARSEKNLSQLDWLVDKTGQLAGGAPDADDGEIVETDDASNNQPKAPRARKGLSPDLPRVQKYMHLSDEEREGAIETFFVKVKEELDIIPL